MSTITIDWDASEVGDLADDIKRSWPPVYRALQRDVSDLARDVQTGWRARAKVTSGRHGHKYPGTIRAEKLGPLEAEIGPLSGMPQGGMGRGFEWGSPTILRNITPGQIFHGAYLGMRVGQDRPHLGMTHTMDAFEAKATFERKVAATVARTWLL